jgi:hypothetical protein
VGRSIQCSSGGRFDLQTPILSSAEDRPYFVENLFESARKELQALLGGQPFVPVDQGGSANSWGLCRVKFATSYFGALAL